jgi:hypothetical protein
MNRFFKYAVESFDWVPKDIQDYLNKIEKVEKNPILVPFREKLSVKNIMDINKSIVENFHMSVNSNIEYIIYNLSSLEQLVEDPQVLNSFYEFLPKLKNLSEKCTLQAVDSNKINIDKNVFKLSKYYDLLITRVISLSKELTYLPATKGNDKIISAAHKLLNSAILFDKIEGKIDWDKRKSMEELDIVFTTNYKDLLGMSSRSTWTSCQDLRPTKNDTHEKILQQILGSVIEQDVGMIYITNSKQYKEYGEQILYRGVVWIVYNKYTKEKALFIPALYPFDSESVKDIFDKFLETKLNIPVVESGDAVQDYITKFTKEHPGPYTDIKLPNEDDVDENTLHTLALKLSEGFNEDLALNSEIAINIYIEFITQLKNENSLFGSLYKNTNTSYDIEKFYDLSFKKTTNLVVSDIFNFFRIIIDDFVRFPQQRTPYNNLIREKLLSHMHSDDLIKLFIYTVSYNIINNPTMNNDLINHVKPIKPTWMSDKMFNDLVEICISSIFWVNKK